MTLTTPLCDLFGVEVPIVQTGMGWVAGARLVTATANAGALGILASARRFTPNGLSVRSLTSRIAAASWS